MKQVLQSFSKTALTEGQGLRTSQNLKFVKTSFAFMILMSFAVSLNANFFNSMLQDFEEKIVKDLSESPQISKGTIVK